MPGKTNGSKQGSKVPKARAKLKKVEPLKTADRYAHAAAKKAASKRTYKDGNQGKKGEPPNQNRLNSRKARAMEIRAENVLRMKQKKKDSSLPKAITAERQKNKKNKPM